MPWIVLIAAVGLACAASIDRVARAPFCVLAVLGLIAVSAIRYKTGYDYDNYVDIYAELASGQSMEQIEWGCTMLNRIAALLFGSPTAVFLLAAAITYGVLGWVLYHESRFAAFSLVAFLLTLQGYWESLSILRQYAAMVAALLAAHYWLEGRRTAYVAALSIAVAFHSTAALAAIVPLLAWFSSRWLVLAGAITAASLGSAILEQWVPQLDLLARFVFCFDGTIAAEGEVTSGTVVFMRTALAVALIVLAEALRRSMSFRGDPLTHTPGGAAWLSVIHMLRPMRSRDFRAAYAGVRGMVRLFLASRLLQHARER